MKEALPYSLFFDQTGTALAAIDLDSGLVLSLNKSFENLTGFNKEELLGENFNLMQHFFKSENKRDRRLDLSLLSEEGFYNDILLPTRDGSIKFVTVKIFHGSYQGKKLGLISLEDETEKLQILRDLTAKHQALETAYVELEEMHTQLKRTQEQVTQASRLLALAELASGISHEMNQPLTGVKGFAQEILDELKSDKPNQKRLKEYASEIVHNSDRMSLLLADLRRFARKESQNIGKKKLEVLITPVLESLEHATRLFGEQFRVRGIRLHSKGFKDISLLAHGHSLEQIFINLLSNSRDAVSDALQKKKIKQGEIHIQAEKVGKEVFIKIKDNGSGIDESIRPRIFNPFVSSKGPTKGMGLGLSISYSLAKEMGGDLYLEDSSASGTTFVLKLKAAQDLSKKEAA